MLVEERDYGANVSSGQCFINNLVSVTLGNTVGGSFFGFTYRCSLGAATMVMGSHLPSLAKQPESGIIRAQTGRGAVWFSAHGSGP